MFPLDFPSPSHKNAFWGSKRLDSKKYLSAVHVCITVIVLIDSLFSESGYDTTGTVLSTLKYSKGVFFL